MLENANVTVSLRKNGELSNQGDFHFALEAERFRKIITTPFALADRILNGTLVWGGHVVDDIDKVFEHSVFS